MGSLCGLRGHQSGHESAHHQSVSESAGGLDLVWPGGDRVGNVRRAYTQPDAGNGRSQGARDPYSTDRASPKGRRLMAIPLRFTFWTRTVEKDRQWMTDFPQGLKPTNILQRIAARLKS